MAAAVDTAEAAAEVAGADEGDVAADRDGSPEEVISGVISSM